MPYIYEKYDYSLFESRFRDYGRLDSFGGCKGLQALFNALEDLAESAGEPIKMDVIGLCCEFSYYDSLEQYNKESATAYKDITDINELFCDIDGESFIVYAN